MEFRLPWPLLGVSLLIATVPLRGQVTEVPETVAPGRFLLEMDALTLQLNHDEANKYQAIGAARTFLSTGLTSTIDLQLGASLFLSETVDTGGGSESNSGIGDVYVRTKWRFYESAETYTMAAVIPYIKIPTNSGGVGNDAVEGGLIVPFATQLSGGFRFDSMGQVDYLRNDDDDGYDARWLVAMALTKQVTKAIGIYGELTANKGTGGTPWEGLLGGGVTLAMSENFVWDFALYTGISSRTDWSSAIRLNWGF